MADQWYYTEQTQRKGPVSEDQLQPAFLLLNLSRPIWLKRAWRVGRKHRRSKGCSRRRMSRHHFPSRIPAASATARCG